MADDNTPVQPVDPAQHNAEIAAKQAAQDISGKPTVTGEFGEATDALDKLAAKVAEKPKPGAQVEPKADAPKVDASKADAPKADAPKADAPKVDSPPPGPDPEALKKAETFFKDSPKLPPGASPKSSEAFSSIKLKAAQEISAREAEIEKLKKQIEDAKKPSTEALEKEKELEELRSWRAKVDVDFDPKFKDFDKSIEQQREFIYAQLSKSPARR